MSPSFTLSPTFFSHFATTPSSMVSLSRGILIISAIYVVIYISVFILITVYCARMGSFLGRILHHTLYGVLGMATLLQIFRILLPSSSRVRL